MEKLIAYCGIDCSVCPAYIATRKVDVTELEKIAQEWTKKFGKEITPENIACDGCTSGSERVSSYCLACEVRQCGIGRGVVTCAHCDEYACEKLEACPAFEAKGREALDKIRAGL
jgi:hypothetical protein